MNVSTAGGLSGKIRASIPTLTTTFQDPQC